MKRLIAVLVILLASAPAARGQTALERARAEAQVNRERTVAKVREQLDGIDALIEANRFADVELRLQTSRRLIRTSDHLTDAQRQELTGRIDAVRARYETTKAEYMAQRDERQAQEIARREQQRRAAEALFAERRHASHWAKLEDFRRTQQYDEAVSEAQAILRTRPNDGEARDTLWEMQYLSNVARYTDVRLDRRRETAGSLLAVESSSIPYAEIHRYPDPDQWDRMSRRRLRDYARQTGVQRGAPETQLKLQKRLDLNVDAVSLQSVLDYLSEASGVPIAVDPHMANETGIDPASHVVTINVRQLTLDQLLAMVLPDGTGYRQEEGHLIVSSREKANPLITITYPIAHLIAEVPDYGETVPSLRISEALSGEGNSGGTLFEPSGFDSTDDGAAPEQRIIEIIEKFVRGTDPRVADWESYGGQATIDFFNGALIISQTETGHRKVMALLSRL